VSAEFQCPIVFVQEQNNDKTLTVTSTPAVNHTGNLETPQPKKKAKRSKKRNKRDEETKLDLASIMKISGKLTLFFHKA